MREGEVDIGRMKKGVLVLKGLLIVTIIGLSWVLYQFAVESSSSAFRPVVASGDVARETEFAILVVDRETRMPMPGVEIKVYDWWLKRTEVRDKAKLLVTDHDGRVSILSEKNRWSISTRERGSKVETIRQTPNRERFSVRIQHPWFKWVEESLLSEFEYENQGLVEGSQWYRVEIRIPLESTK